MTTRNDVIRALDAAYNDLVDVEGESTIVDSALNVVHQAILEYDRAVNPPLYQGDPDPWGRTV